MKAENTEAAGAATNSQKISRNALWSGVESAVNLLSVVLTTVAVARVIGHDKLGQERLGYYNYIVWITTISVSLGSVGLPATAAKYMAEYLNRGETGIARATYLATLRIQSYLSFGVLAIGTVLLLWLGKGGFSVPSMLLIGAMVPRLIANVPSSANNASETMRRNTGPAVAGTFTTTSISLLSLLIAYLYGGSNPAIGSRNWDLIGLAGAVFAGSMLECIWKLRTVEKWLGHVRAGKIDPELKKRMFAYSGQGLVLLILNIVVWDRSDIMILHWLNPDERQVHFFSVAFSLAERMLMIPTVLCASIAATMLAQYGRERERLKEMTVDGGRYALLLSLPLLLGMSCISQPLVLLVYHPPYRAMIPILALVSVMAIPKALMLLPSIFLQAQERQGFLIFWGCTCGVVDIGMDLLLVRQHGAWGAALANGTAQGLAAIGIWTYAWRTDKLDLKLLDFARILLSGGIMVAGVLTVNRFVSGYGGLLVAIATGAVLYVLAVRLTGALQARDVSRFLVLGRPLPPNLAQRWRKLLEWLAPEPA